MRVSQVAFSADENFLVLSAESGGGLAVYDVQSLMQGNTQAAFEIATNGTALRALVPNPTLETAELYAAVSTKGELMIADLKAKQFLTGAQGQVLKTGVSYVSWSKKGKQLIAGLGDGSLYQMTPEGKGTGDVPKPPGVEGDQFGKILNGLMTLLLTPSVSSILWLENDVFFVAHTPTTTGDGMTPPTMYHLITRHPKQSPPSITYQKLNEPILSFLPDRLPSFQFVQRLRNFPPNLDDVIVLASSTSTDIGLITRSKVPLSNDSAAENISNVFTTTTMADDTRRAQLPMSEDVDTAETSPIGLGFDLSSKDKVEKPLPQEEFDASQGPLPALMVLNNEGILSAWWFVYAESIRQGTTYQGLTVAGGAQVQQQQQQNERQASPFAKAAQDVPALGQNTFGNTSTPTTSPVASAFGKPSTLGSTTASGPSFGAPSALGRTSTPFGGGMTGPSTNQKEGPVFGQSSFGNRGSPWATPSAGTAATSGIVFGQSGFNTSRPAPFGASTTNSNPATTSSAFTSFASKPSPFMTAAPASEAGNIFSKPATTAFFGSGMDTDTSFGAPLKKGTEAAKPSLGLEGFNLGSTFKKDDSTANDGQKPSGNVGRSMFGSGFGDALGAAQKEVITPQSNDADMDGDDTPPDQAQALPAEKDSNVPAAGSAHLKTSFPQATIPPKAGGLFGTQAQSKTTPAAVGSSQPTGFAIATPSKPTPLMTMPDDSRRTADQPRPSVETSPEIKKEPQSDDEGDISSMNDHDTTTPLGYRTPEASQVSKTPEPPLPPESTSKTSFAPGDSSNSSKSSDDAPLPPDFLPSKTKLKQVEAVPPEQASLPPGDEDDRFEEPAARDPHEDEGEGTDRSSANLDEEGSGVDVAQEISPSTDPNQSPEVTPESSFGGPQDKSFSGTLFGSGTAPAERQKGKPPLFGEVGKTSAPYLPPPTKAQQSPRSPSPVRSNTLGDSLRPDNARSISAPGPYSALNSRKAAPSRLAVLAKLQPSPEGRREQEPNQRAAEQAKKREKQEQDLSDQEDENVQKILATEVERTLVLDPFLAHQDYVRGEAKPGIPGQIEKVYRDINSMIDTLGLNARSLKAFIKGHEEMYKPDGRTRDDLEKRDWCLIEIGDLPKIEDNLSEQLGDISNQNTQGTINECRAFRKEITILRAKGADIVRAVKAHSNPEEIESARNAPLSLDQATQQHELRKKMARFQKLLAEAEENITVLRTKLASCDTSKGKGPLSKRPTVEAVTNTIKKMTNIVKKKEDDIEALENQMRQLRFPSVASLDSRESSPFHPASSRRTPASKLGASMNGYNTPSRSSVLGRSVNGEGTPRKGVADFTSEEVQRYQEKARRRREINEIIKTEFEKGKPRIRPLD